jgi:hypothetical protein
VSVELTKRRTKRRSRRNWKAAEFLLHMFIAVKLADHGVPSWYGVG